jgi:hypothetical protein
MGLDTKTYWLTARQSQCNFDFDFDKEFSLSWVASKQATRKGAPVQPVKRGKKNDRTSDYGDCNCNCKGVGQ